MERILTSKPIKDNKTLWYRENSSDMIMWKENPYKKLAFYDDDVVLDIGANIGDFPLRFANKVKWVHSYEPIKDTFDVLEKNVSYNEIKNCTLYPAAVTREDGEISIFLSESAKMAHAAASVLPIRGRTELRVQALSFENQVRSINPSVIKMDIEGAERDILDNVSDDVFANCRLFIVETHVQFLRGDAIEWNERIGERFTKLFGTSSEYKVMYFRKHHCSVWKFEKK